MRYIRGVTKVSNDLISRAAVLEMIEDLITINAKTKFHNGIDCVCKADLVRNINQMPTAYDVDKIVEKVRKAKDEYGMVDYINDKPVIAKEQAIGIIKKEVSNERNII